MTANTFTVLSRGKKRGTTVMLTPGQRQAVDEALGGYLRALESSAADYPLFPGRFASKAGAYMNPDGRPIHKQTVYRWFKQAEELAEVPHIPGRCAYGIRRVATDAFLENGASLKALQLNGGWTSPAIPTQKYAARETDQARREAATLRALSRGEENTGRAEKTS